MTEQDAFLTTIFDKPEDYAPRGVFADWLDDQRDDRAELMRHGSAGDALVPFIHMVAEEGKCGFPNSTDQPSAWSFVAASFLRKTWKPIVAIKSPLTIRHIGMSADGGVAESAVLRPNDGTVLVAWKQAPGSNYSYSPVYQPLANLNWLWLTSRGEGVVTVMLWLERHESLASLQTPPTPPATTH